MNIQLTTKERQPYTIPQRVTASPDPFRSLGDELRESTMRVTLVRQQLFLDKRRPLCGHHGELAWNTLVKALYTPLLVWIHYPTC